MSTPIHDVGSLFYIKGAKLVSFVNPFSFEVVSQDKTIIDGVDYWYVDGILLCKLLKWKHNVVIKRTSFDFSSIAHDVFEFCNQRKLSVAVIASTFDEVTRATEIFKKNYPEINFCIISDGFVDESKLKHLKNKIVDFKPDVILLGMGTPNQEKFGLLLKKLIDHNCLLYTCGGFVTQTSIREDYYYPIVKKLNLRALQRIILHSHVRNRVLKKYFPFVIKYLTS